MNKRYYFLYGFIIVFVTLIFLRLTELTIIDGEKYLESSEKRLYKTVPIKAPRGEIFDRYGRYLVKNTMSFTVQVNKTKNQTNEDLNALIKRLILLFEKHNIEITDSFPVNVEDNAFIFEESEDAPRAKEYAWKEKYNNLDKEASAAEVYQYFLSRYGITEEDPGLARRILGVRYDMESQGFSYNTPFNIANGVSLDLITEIKEGGQDYAGVDIVTQPVREYENPTTAVHILGRIGNLSKEEYEQNKDLGYKMNDTIGKQGLEKYYESYLRGVDGRSSIQTNINGRAVDVLTSTEPIPGNNLITTIDLDLQKATERILRDNIKKISETARTEQEGKNANAGAAVVLDVKSGEVLSIASEPTYDISRFNIDYAKLVEDKNRPMFNRALAGTYAPGSTFKMLTAIAGLEEGKISTKSIIRCLGIYKYYKGYQPRCWIYSQYMRTHGDETVAEAIRDSCNYFFYDVGREVTIEKLNEYAKKFGFGQPTGIELENEESSGRLAGPEDRKKRKETWYPGDTLQAAIGQSDNAFTPIQLANFVATLANGGTRYKVRLGKSIQSGTDGRILEEFESEVADRIEIKEENLKEVLKGMRMVATEGTARSIFYDSIVDVAAKTGTAQVVRGQISNGVIVAFAPYDDPEIAVCAIVEKGGSGAAVANIAKEIIDFYFSPVKDADDVKKQNTLLQ
ncbi:MAG: penicillin-binding protein 2 [Clostridiaceae bacterium]|nr:penicillin-binding protein 2 [Clostridiaceae bacterium]